MKNNLIITNPFGEWVEITEENARYQIRHGGKIVECLEEGGDL